MAKGITCRVVEADGPPIDLAAWLRLYVATVLEVEGIVPRDVATPPPAIGNGP